ncbi:hypothetical protein EG68_00591 [Paragonimus skrjabini miyazakii]|uniref:Uncharacterized protein n=1 Tax=Paragonimus skrjabini miyazakii TaxID=59628 RepID=A0A8S9Z914_9TREM|nr:hypothetical protein EG68_00591 [Paragonimus skrjabini miyazakii]
MHARSPIRPRTCTVPVIQIPPSKQKHRSSCKSSKWPVQIFIRSERLDALASIPAFDASEIHFLNRSDIHISTACFH